LAMGTSDADEVDFTATHLSAVRGALADLRPRYQQAITLRYLAGLTQAEAAEAMGCSLAVMAVVLHRALNALRRALAEER
jgi:RNA polymerase sigma factor (sigma-70 family)